MNKRPGGDVQISITGEVGPEVAFYGRKLISRLPGWQHGGGELDRSHMFFALFAEGEKSQ